MWPMPVMPLVSHRSHRRHPSPLDIFNLFTWTPPSILTEQVLHCYITKKNAFQQDAYHPLEWPSLLPRMPPGIHAPGHTPPLAKDTPGMHTSPATYASQACMPPWSCTPPGLHVPPVTHPSPPPRYAHPIPLWTEWLTDRMMILRSNLRKPFVFAREPWLALLSFFCGKQVGVGSVTVCRFKFTESLRKV